VTMPAAGAAVTVAGVSIKLGGTHALSNVSFTVPRASLVAVVGPSGSGKSTLIRVLTRTVRPDSGEVHIEAERTGTGARVGLVPQLEPASLALPLSVEEVVALGRPRLGLCTSARERSEARGLLDVLGLGGLYRRTLTELSGGQRQRVAIARALMAGPEVLVCDEPTSGADPVLVNDVMDALRTLSSRNVTIIVATHDLERVARRCDWMIALRDGKSVFDGDPARFSEADFNLIYGTGEDR
jgi:ABC-type Mn2+/Zn2+ transport system ATPase subunit